MPTRSGLALLLAVLVGLAVSLVPGAAALADPAGSDGNNPTLEGKLQAATQAYNDAKGRLDATKARQAELASQIQVTEGQLATVTDQVQAVAVQAYKGGRVSGLNALLSAGTDGEFLDRAMRLQDQITLDNGLLRRLHALRTRYDQQRSQLDFEAGAQQNLLAVMDKHVKEAKAALAAAGGGAPGQGPAAGAASATPAPRNPDGSWPPESCSVKDPTTSGCLTPRTLHALQQARAAGFTHYTACFRNASSGEHPLGRACDFSANATTFVNAAATGADKAYGDRLAAWFLANADRLAVLYVIWYRQIWLPGIGWQTYHGDGTPAGDHMNHVHLSVQ
jgi:hypothetical protein